MFKKMLATLLMAGVLAMGAAQLVAADHDVTQTSLRECEGSEFSCIPSTNRG